jgi:hypothetical protein
MAAMANLEAERHSILEELAGLSAMRRGSISEQFVESTGRDGSKKKRGPYYVYTHKEKGQTVSRRLTSPGQVTLCKAQIQAFRRFQELTAHLLEIGEQISDLALGGETEKKNFTVQVQVEKDAEIVRFLARAGAAQQVDLEAWETALRPLVLAAGAKALGALLRGVGCGRTVRPVVCGCGTRMESRGLRTKEVLTILGPVTYTRSLFQCPTCGKTRCPGDEELDLVGTTRSPGVRRMMARAGSQTTFKEAREDLAVYAGLEVSPKDIERVAETLGEDLEAWSRREQQACLRTDHPVPLMKTIPLLYICYDGTGVPMMPVEVAGRKGKQADGSAKTREAKLGCVFTQTTTDAKGFPVRDRDSTSFVGHIESAEEFGWRIYAEAVRRGLETAHNVVILGDGAEWIRGIAEMHFPGATQIVDLYHAREHVANLCKLLFAPGDKQVEQHHLRWWHDLDAGAVEKLIQEASQHLPDEPSRCKAARTELAYLEKNKERMRYAQFRARGLFVGSGVIEAGCKSVVGLRLKRSGMEWSLRGANAILSLRCATLSRRLEDYWEDRAA